MACVFTILTPFVRQCRVTAGSAFTATGARAPGPPVSSGLGRVAAASSGAAAALGTKPGGSSVLGAMDSMLGASEEM